MLEDVSSNDLLSEPKEYKKGQKRNLTLLFNNEFGWFDVRSKYRFFLVLTGFEITEKVNSHEIIRIIVKKH